MNTPKLSFTFRITQESFVEVLKRVDKTKQLSSYQRITPTSVMTACMLWGLKNMPLDGSDGRQLTIEDAVAKAKARARRKAKVRKVERPAKKSRKALAKRVAKKTKPARTTVVE